MMTRVSAHSNAAPNPPARRSRAGVDPEIAIWLFDAGLHQRTMEGVTKHSERRARELGRTLSLETAELEAHNEAVEYVPALMAVSELAKRALAGGVDPIDTDILRRYLGRRSTTIRKLEEQAASLRNLRARRAFLDVLSSIRSG